MFNHTLDADSMKKIQEFKEYFTDEKSNDFQRVLATAMIAIEDCSSNVDDPVLTSPSTNSYPPSKNFEMDFSSLSTCIDWVIEDDKGKLFEAGKIIPEKISDLKNVLLTFQERDTDNDRKSIYDNALASLDDINQYFKASQDMGGPTLN